MICGLARVKIRRFIKVIELHKVKGTEKPETFIGFSVMYFYLKELTTHFIKPKQWLISSRLKTEAIESLAVRLTASRVFKAINLTLKIPCISGYSGTNSTIRDTVVSNHDSQARITKLTVAN